MCNTFSILPCPVFSVIIPVYNVAPYLRACLDSVVAAVEELGRKEENVGGGGERKEVEKVGGGGERNGKASSGFERSTASVQPTVEIICVDDGSADGSGKILDEYLSGKGSDPLPERCCFRVIHQQNAGVSAARNAALDVAKGDWILFVDADDVVSKYMLRVVYSAVVRHPDADLVKFGGWNFEDGDVETCPNRNETATYVVIRCGDRLDYGMIWDGFISYCYRSSVLPKDGFPPYLIGEDLVFLAKAIVNAKVCVNTDERLYGYRLRNGSAIRSHYSLRKFKNLIDYSVERFNVLLNSRKIIDPSIYRRIGLELTENALGGLMSLGGDERREAWKLWFEMVRKIRSYAHYFTKWTNLVVWVCVVTRIKSVAYVLCYLPYSLKAKGFHR